MKFNLDAAATEVEHFSLLRDWTKFHSLRSLLLATMGELGELAELLQWKSDLEVDESLSIDSSRYQIEDEFADVMIYLIRFAQVAKIDPSMAILRKIKENELRFPIPDSVQHDG